MKLKKKFKKAFVRGYVTAMHSNTSDELKLKFFDLLPLTNDAVLEINAHCKSFLYRVHSWLKPSVDVFEEAGYAFYCETNDMDAMPEVDYLAATGRYHYKSLVDGSGLQHKHKEKVAGIIIKLAAKYPAITLELSPETELLEIV